MSSITLRRCVVDRDTNKTMYDRVLEDVEALGDTILSKHEIDKTFFRAKPDFKGNIYYEKSGGKSFRAHFIAEPFTDDGVKSLRMILALRCPTGAPEELKKLFRNGIAVLDSIRAADEVSEAERSQRFEITESIFCENGEGDLTDNIIMLLRLQQTFETPPTNNSPATPNSQRRRITKVDEPAESSSNNSGDVDMEDTPVGERKVGDVYPARMLPEVEGPLFALDKAQLRQHDYRDADGNLIAAHEVRVKLTEGTLVLVMLELVTIQIYHVLADKLRVLDHGDGEPFVPTVPPMPERREPRTPAKRPWDDAADSAFDSFGSKASPAKKAKQTKSRK
ncbi:hypothetical protein DFH08DRAFT_984157 [Mycena albidolilacea]|uniref:Uncharacterized protein n=1 Tax=Mycena albidolilacea TaxID=1033008 RepID=A0AAD7AWJ1_9AGAR|nr:hypothetical protein DFH08DRAFT_984157 [Mycena albidolilacea]